jgi:hypothetical protein
MKLTEIGESRIRGYLFILGQSLRTFLPGDVVTDALREVESHIRERAAGVDAVPDERVALEKVLSTLGSPQKLAQVYAMEMSVDEALATRRLVPTLRAVWHLAGTTLGGFGAAIGLFFGYASGLAFIAIAFLKLVIPDHVGLIVVNGVPESLGMRYPLPQGAEVRGGYWIVPLCLMVGLGILVGTHRGAVRMLAWWKARRAGPTSA